MAKNKISDVSTQSIEVFGRNRSRKMFVKFVLCALFLRSVSGGLLPLNESDDSVTRVIERLFGINETVYIITDGIMIDVEFEIPNPKIIWNLNATQKLQGKLQPVYNFIIQVIDSKSLYNVLRNLNCSPLWYCQNTVKGTFLIIISEIDNVFRHLWMFSITNSVILINGNGPSQCKLYQSIRRSLENGCGKKLNIMQEDCQDGPTLTFKKGFQSYHGCPIGYRKDECLRPEDISFVDETKTELTKRSRCADMKLPEMYKSRVRCPHCFVEYDPSSKACELTKSKVKGKFPAQILKKIESGKELTKFQKRYSRRIRNEAPVGCNTFIELCGFCNHKRITHLKKPKKPIAQPPAIQIPNKKRKKKDKFAGLNKDVISVVQLKDSPDKNTISKKPQLEPILKLKSYESARTKNKKLKSLLANFKNEKKQSPLQQFLSSI